MDISVWYIVLALVPCRLTYKLITHLISLPIILLSMFEWLLLSLRLVLLSSMHAITIVNRWSVSPSAFDSTWNALTLTHRRPLQRFVLIMYSDNYRSPGTAARARSARDGRECVVSPLLVLFIFRSGLEKKRLFRLKKYSSKELAVSCCPRVPRLPNIETSNSECFSLEFWGLGSRVSSRFLRMNSSL